MKTDDTQKKAKGVFVTNDQVRLTGSPDVARFLAQCLYWSGIEMVQQRQGWFYKSRDEWQAETWLSRYKQEKAREQLKKMGLLEEFRERRNIGIRLWFRLNRGLYNALLNQLLTVKSSKDINDSTNSKESLIELSDCTDSSVSIDISIDTEDISTIVPNCPYKAEISTIVSDFTAINDDEYSDNHCVNNHDVEIYVENDDSVEPEQSDEPVGSPLSAKLTDCPDNKNTVDPEIFLFCHPFIYQFVRSCAQHAEAGYQTARELLEGISVNGFTSDEVQQGLFRFVEVYGHDILNWYQNHSPVMINPLNKVDIEDAVQVSKVGF